MDAQLLSSWLAITESAHERLHRYKILCTLLSLIGDVCCYACRLDVFMCFAHLPKLFGVCMKCLLAERITVADAAAGTMKVVRAVVIM